jgi:Cytochrome P460
MRNRSRFRRPAVLALGVLLAGSLWSISKATVHSGQPPTKAQPEGPAPPPPPEALQLWKYIHSPANDYRKWAAFPGGPKLLQATELPHGDWVAVYVNPAGSPALEKQLANPDPMFEMPAGSILVKENYPAKSTPPCTTDLLTLTVMYKPPADVLGGNARYGDTGWFWVMYSPDGYVQLISSQSFLARTKQFDKYRGEVEVGSPKLCTDCHSGANSSPKGLKDYIWNLDQFKKPG